MNERLQTENALASSQDSPEVTGSIEQSFRELDERRGNGLIVQLLWETATNRMFIKVEDEIAGGKGLQFDVPGADAHEAFLHPYAYAPRAAEVSELHSQ